MHASNSAVVVQPVFVVMADEHSAQREDVTYEAVQEARPYKNSMASLPSLPPEPNASAGDEQTGGYPQQPRRFQLIPQDPDEAIYANAEELSANYEFSTMFRWSSSPPIPGTLTGFLRLGYEAVHQVTYYVLALLVAPLAVLIFGLIAGVLSVVHAWLVSPVFRIAEVSIMRVGKLFSVFVSHFLVPVYEAISYVFSKINVTYKAVPYSHDMTHASIT